MTAVEFLIEKYYANEGIMKIEWLEQAKKKERQDKIEFACKVVEVSSEKYIQGKTTEQIAKELIKS